MATHRRDPMKGVFLDDDSEPASPAKLVRLSTADVAAAHRVMKVLAEASEPEPVQIASGHRSPTVTRDALIEIAWQEFERRGRRMQLLPSDMFGEPAWEMLLILYAELQRTRLNIALLSRKLDLAPSTALRWLNYLEHKALVVREPHPTDLRTANIKLTSIAIEALDLYLSEAIAGTPWTGRQM
jgi:DNA-binding MarR family transcriptional regulator